MKEDELETQALEPPVENKAKFPVEKKDFGQEKAEKPKKSGNTLRVQVKPRRAVTGIGGAGTIAEIDKGLAKELEADGFVTILPKE